MKPIFFLKTHILFLIFLAFYFGFAVTFYKDFGPTSDEKTELMAAQNLEMYFSRPTSYGSITDNDYHDVLDNPQGHHPLITEYQRSYQFLQTLFNPKGYYEWGHLFNLIFGSLYFIITYLLFYKGYKSSKIAFVAVLFLALTPRVLGDIPANNKDMPFAVMYLAAVAAIYIFSIKNYNTYIKILVLGTIFGLMETFRAIGFSIYFVYLIYNAYLFFIDRANVNKKRILNFILELFIIGIFSLFVSVSIFPWLGANFYINFYTLFVNSKSFQYWDDTIFFAGKFLMKGQRPWYYLFTWIFITTPVFILALLGVSTLYFKTLFKNKLFNIFFIAIFVNIIFYLVLQPVIYNGLRHFLFLIPLITLLSCVIFIQIFRSIKKRLYKMILISLLVLNSLSILYNYITLHPYEYIYFNELIGGLQGANGKYELDYWGTTYKEATEWFLKNRELSQSDFIYACNNEYSVDYYSGRKFFISYGILGKANYTICDVDNERKGGFEGKILYEVKRQGVILNIIREHTKTE